MTVAEAIAKRTEYYLAKQHISLYALAKKACVPISTLQNLFRGHTKSPTVTLLFKIADAFGVTVEEFLSDPLFSRENLELY